MILNAFLGILVALVLPGAGFSLAFFEGLRAIEKLMISILISIAIDIGIAFLLSHPVLFEIFGGYNYYTLLFLLGLSSFIGAMFYAIKKVASK